MRTQFTTTIDTELQTKFKTACNSRGINMNDVLEAFMEAYIGGEYSVERRVKYSVKRVNNGQ